MDTMSSGGAPPAPEDAGREPPEAEMTPDLAVLARAVRRLSRTSVMVIGDVMLDRYVYGTVDRISPEAPIPILAVE